MSKKKVFLIAPEASGSKIGSSILKFIQEKTNESFEIKGIYSEEASKIIGEKSIFDIKDLSVMGFLDVLRNVFKIKKIIKNTAKFIKIYNPDILISIDSYDFCIHSVKEFYKISKIKNKNESKIKFFHIVSPSVWIYRKKRAEILSNYYHHLFYLLDFEKEYYRKFDIKTTFVGYINISKINFQIEEERQNIIILALGSRIREVANNINILAELIDKAKLFAKKYTIFLPTTEITDKHIENFIKERQIESKVIFSKDSKKKEEFYKKASFVIAKSGTNVMESVAMGIPTIVYYSIGFFNYFLVTLMKIFRFFKIKYITILNIIANREIVKEFVFKGEMNKQKSKIVVDYFINNFINNNFDIKKYKQDLIKYLEKIKIKNFEEIVSNEILKELS